MNNLAKECCPIYRDWSIFFNLKFNTAVMSNTFSSTILAIDLRKVGKKEIKIVVKKMFSFGYKNQLQFCKSQMQHLKFFAFVLSVSDVLYYNLKSNGHQRHK